jgi:hypothetical protein
MNPNLTHALVEQRAVEMRAVADEARRARRLDDAREPRRFARALGALTPHRRRMAAQTAPAVSCD